MAEEIPEDPSSGIRVIRLWQWPNILSLDAVAIALAWQSCLESIRHHPIEFAEQIILGLSVWLTYMADRLLDVRKRKPVSLLSLRHSWIKKYSFRLWSAWIPILALNVLLALYFLDNRQFFRGSILLCLTLLYTVLNQLLSRYWFPKEACVGFIFSAGLLVFLPEYNAIKDFWLLSSVFVVNCLLISLKEQRIDAALNQRTLALGGPLLLCFTLAGCTVIHAIYFKTNLMLALMSGSSITLLLCLYFRSEKSNEPELFRVQADVCLLVTPLLYTLLKASPLIS